MTLNYCFVNKVYTSISLLLFLTYSFLLLFLTLIADYPSAVKHYTESIKRNPKDHRVYSNRAACYTKLAEFGMALRDIELCLEIEPTFLKAYLRKGTICLTVKEVLKAQQAYEKALEIDSTCQVY